MINSPIEPDGRIDVNPEGDVVSAYDGVNAPNFSGNPLWLRREEMAHDIPATTAAGPTERPLPPHLEAAREIINRAKKLPGSDPEDPIYGVPESKGMIGRRKASLQKEVEAEHQNQGK